MRRKWSIATLCFCILGFLWIVFNSKENTGTTLCYSQWLYHFPCPTCGITRSIQSIFSAKWIDALYFNPLGYLAVFCMCLFPIWILFDLVTKNFSYEKSILSFWKMLRKRNFILLFSSCILLVWGWNIYKHLC